MLAGLFLVGIKVYAVTVGEKGDTASKFKSLSVAEIENVKIFNLLQLFKQLFNCTDASFGRSLVSSDYFSATCGYLFGIYCLFAHE